MRNFRWETRSETSVVSGAMKRVETVWSSACIQIGRPLYPFLTTTVETVWSSARIQIGRPLYPFLTTCERDPSKEAQLLGTLKPERALPSSTVLSRDFWLLAVGTPLPAQGGAAGGAAGGSDLADIRAAVLQTAAAMQQATATMSKLKLRQRQLELERLYIRPIAIPPASSGSSSSPRPDEAPAIKVATIEFYGLWASQEQDKHQRQVYTMVPDAHGNRQAVSFKDAILSHIWPSSQPGEARAIGAALGLPRDFHVSERNFLILPKVVEKLIDADALLLFPSRGPPRAATFRSGTVENAPLADQPAVAQYVGRTLYLPLEAQDRVPFMRLLGWKAVSALRAEAEAAAAVEVLPADLELDSSRDAEGVAAVSRLVETVREAGWRFRR